MESEGFAWRSLQKINRSVFEIVSGTGLDPNVGIICLSTFQKKIPNIRRPMLRIFLISKASMIQSIYIAQIEILKWIHFIQSVDDACLLCLLHMTGKQPGK